MGMDPADMKASLENSRAYMHDSDLAQKATLDAVFPDVTTLEHALRDKFTQHVSKDSDRFRQAFRMYTATEGITYNVFKEKTGIHAMRACPSFSTNPLLVACVLLPGGAREGGG
jgi:hypothetical protein